MVIKSGYNAVNGDYVFAKIASDVKEYEIKNNKKVTDLGVGDVKLPPPKTVCDAMLMATQEYYCENFKGYPPDFGYPFLKNAISNYYKRLDVEVLPDEIFITEGAKNAIGNIFCHLFPPFDL